MATPTCTNVYALVLTATNIPRFLKIMVGFDLMIPGLDSPLGNLIETSYRGAFSVHFSVLNKTYCNRFVCCLCSNAGSCNLSILQCKITVRRDDVTRIYIVKTAALSLKDTILQFNEHCQ